MRYCRFDDEEKYTDIILDCDIKRVDQLIAILKNADYYDWLEGLGQPNCYQDIVNWKVIGKFLEKCKNAGLMTIGFTRSLIDGEEEDENEEEEEEQEDKK